MVGTDSSLTQESFREGTERAWLIFRRDEDIVSQAFNPCAQEFKIGRCIGSSWRKHTKHIVSSSPGWNTEHNTASITKQNKNGKRFLHHYSQFSG